METLVQCESCGEDSNRADWEAAGGDCVHCGETAIGNAGQRISALTALRRRLELELVWRPVVSHA
ncbi:hypothetical protein EBX31_05625 [bacterium]|jgi:hypothetical protein|nr:hypothetical protein [bacterium]